MASKCPSASSQESDSKKSRKTVTIEKKLKVLTKTSSGENRLILHFHYTTWPDFGVPQSPEAFYKFLNVVRASGVLEPDVGPAVVHCSAGIGRSGTFCLVDTILMMRRRWRSLAVRYGVRQSLGGEDNTNDGGERGGQN
ncbi:Tyrosine-protein phosphatase non-receptor type 1 [Portunus trituberculatus]|uniref:protein-tyrosine-phosphatase n=1 Tax=Portunus trituberculatus TaxID=210409 RepID=A0A5B7GJP6_PORTR|nr:Tyrosine-protein phosphatase non-receptor type 1 [Portunus trituberculatus]